MRTTAIPAISLFIHDHPALTLRFSSAVTFPLSVCLSLHLLPATGTCRQSEGHLAVCVRTSPSVTLSVVCICAPVHCLASCAGEAATSPQVHWCPHHAPPSSGLHPGWGEGRPRPPRCSQDFLSSFLQRFILCHFIGDFAQVILFTGALPCSMLLTSSFHLILLFSTYHRLTYYVFSPLVLFRSPH